MRLVTNVGHEADNQLLCLSCIPVIIGAITIWTAPWHPTIGPLIGYYLVAVSRFDPIASKHEQHETDHQSFGAPYVLLLSLAAANTSGSTKKAITSGAVFIGE